MRKRVSPTEFQHNFLCMLDSDDEMHPERVYEQTKELLSDHHRDCTLLGCTFARNPPDSTWYYAKWANELTDKRIYFEQFREITLLQPTWMISCSWFESLGGYIEAPHPDSGEELSDVLKKNAKDPSYN
jgi:hypothetical protein